MKTFQAVWPIVQGWIPNEELIEEAKLDLNAVAARHGVKIAGPARFRVVDGRNQPGSQGAAQCVVAVAPVTTRVRNYGWMKSA